MRYFKSTLGEFFGVDAGQEKLIKSDWVEVTKADIDFANKPTPEQLILDRINELKMLLRATDYKDLPSYDKRATPEWDAVMVQRQAWREEIRNLERK
jgi:hypothetical protein